MTYMLSVETVSTYEHAPEYGAAVDAARERYNRLRNAGVKAQYMHTTGTSEVIYTDALTGDKHTLTYTDLEVNQ